MICPIRLALLPALKEFTDGDVVCCWNLHYNIRGGCNYAAVWFELTLQFTLYNVTGSSYFAVGGFDWNLQFNWHGVPNHEVRDEHFEFSQAT